MQTPPHDNSSSSETPHQPVRRQRGVFGWFVRILGGLFILGLAGVAALGLGGLVAMAIAYPNLPDVSELQEYRPKLPLRVFTADGLLIGEYGEERRNMTPINEIPQIMKDAVLAIEDARFYEHGGVDYIGLARAALANLRQAKSQGASTITMQVARNVYLSSEKTFTRKIYEVLLTTKLEHTLTKDQILEIYMNQIFLGNRAYGFAAASEVYFGKPLKDISIAEAAMLAGLPRAPSANNPISNPKRARARQLYIIERMQENGFITAAQAEQAKAEPLRLRTEVEGYGVHAEYVAETARQLMFAQYGDETYTRGLNVYTTIESADQEVAYAAVRKGIQAFDRRQGYRGPEKFVDLPKTQAELEDQVDDILVDHPSADDLVSAVVLSAEPSKVTVMRANGETLTISGSGLRRAQAALSARAQPAIKLRRGAIIRIVATDKKKGLWAITQLPDVEAALVALDPRNGAIKALVGGFDFNANKFNHVTQAWRQPGSTFKPFIYSASLEKGFSPATIIYDGPLFYGSDVTGGQPWEPKNYEGGFQGSMTMRTALTRSRNMVSIRILEAITPQFGQEWVARFGFDADKHPPYLTMALGAGSVTPMQMAAGIGAFANGGYQVHPLLVTRVTDHRGKVLSETPPTPPSEDTRAIDARNAFITASMLNDVARVGTAARAQGTLKRPDLYGKTGTTNDAHDAWFVGFQPTLAAAVWMGYDKPRPLGARETGGGLALPIWIDFMQPALKGAPVVTMERPEGVERADGDWTYSEYAMSGSVRSLGVPVASPRPRPRVPSESGQPEPSAGSQERRDILDMFRD